VTSEGQRRIIRARDLPATLGLSRSTIWRMVKDGRFPPPIKLSDNATGFRATDVDKWLDEREAAYQLRIRRSWSWLGSERQLDGESRLTRRSGKPREVHFRIRMARGLAGPTRLFTPGRDGSGQFFAPMSVQMTLPICSRKHTKADRRREPRDNSPCQGAGGGHSYVVGLVDWSFPAVRHLRHWGTLAAI
jgi:prophage regulatory protein